MNEWRQMRISSGEAEWGKLYCGGPVSSVSGMEQFHCPSRKPWPKSPTNPLSKWHWLQKNLGAWEHVLIPHLQAVNQQG